MAHNISSKSHSGTVKILRWNVKGLGNPVKRAKVLTHLKSLDSDIVLLQETHAKRSVQMVLRASWLGQVYQANFGAKARGVVILFRKNIPFIQNKTIADLNGRFLVVSGSLCSTPVTFVNIYGPNFDCPEFFRDVFNSIPNIDQTNIIVGGDMNCATIKIRTVFKYSPQKLKHCGYMEIVVSYWQRVLLLLSSA